MSRYRKTMVDALKEVNEIGTDQYRKYLEKLTPGQGKSLDENNMALMKKAAGGAMQTLKMKDGKLKMDSFTASAIMAIYKAVNPKNKKTMENLINTGNKAAMMKLQKFAMSKSGITPGQIYKIVQVLSPLDDGGGGDGGGDGRVFLGYPGPIPKAPGTT